LVARRKINEEESNDWGHSLGQESGTKLVLISDCSDSLTEQEEVISSQQAREMPHSELELPTTRLAMHLLNLDIES